jgi:hypothetical membrane protein
VRPCGAAGIFGVLAFISAIITLQLFGPEIDWTRHYVSEFANGPLGWLFVTAAAVHGLGNLALTAGLRRSLGPGALHTAGVLLFGLAALGILAAAVFPTDSGGEARTFAGLVHRVAAIASFPVELISLLLISASFSGSTHWRRLAGRSFAWSAIAAATLVWLFLAVFWNKMPGLAERVALATFLVWEFGASWSLARSPSDNE